MGMIEQKKRIMMMQNSAIDTSPVIESTGNWTRTFGLKSENNLWGLTKFYDINDPVDGTNRTTYINGYVGADTGSITFQYYISNGNADWYYFAGMNPRRIIAESSNRVTSISFSIELSEIDNSYAFIVETGEIIFAGKNTPYYGHRNISELE